jgi:hypothetical protein
LRNPLQPTNSKYVSWYGQKNQDFCIGLRISFFTLREEHGLKVFESRALRKLRGPKREEETGGREILCNLEHNDLYHSSNIIKVIK